MVDDRQQHFEVLLGVDGMGDVGGHDDDIAGLGDQGISTDRDFGFALKNLDDGVAGRRVGADAFTGAEGKQGDGDFRPLHESAADDFSRLDIDQTGKIYGFRQGEIFYKGQNLDSLDLVQYRRQVSYCFQQPTLFDETVKDNLALPFAIRKQDFAEKRVQEALKQVDLPADYLDKKITTLSGGEKQRVALIRNLLFRPELLLLDEVTTGLDEESKQIVHQLIAQVHQEGTTIVQVTHDQEELAASKQLLHMEKGGVLK